MLNVILQLNSEFESTYEIRGTLTTTATTQQLPKYFVQGSTENYTENCIADFIYIFFSAFQIQAQNLKKGFLDPESSLPQTTLDSEEAT